MIDETRDAVVAAVAKRSGHYSDLLALRMGSYIRRSFIRIVWYLIGAVVR